MELAMIGLGKMGANMTERLVRGGHRVVGYDLNPESVAQIVEKGAEGAGSLEDLAGKLSDPQIVWIMVPAGGPVDKTIEALLPCLRAGSVIIDGGNSYYRDTLRRAEQCAASGVHIVDCGTSGGIWGLAEGYSMMVGGDNSVVESLRPIFETLAPSSDQGWGESGPRGPVTSSRWFTTGLSTGSCRLTPRVWPSWKPRTSLGSISTRSPKSGATGQSLGPGCWTSRPKLWQRIPTWRALLLSCPTRVKDAGLYSKPSISMWRHRSSPIHFSAGLAPTTRRSMPIGSCRPCVRSSVVTRSRKKKADETTVG